LLQDTLVIEEGKLIAKTLANGAALGNERHRAAQLKEKEEVAPIGVKSGRSNFPV